MCRQTTDPPLPLALTDFCDSDEDSDDESKDGHTKDGPDSSKISTTTEDGKDHEASPAKGHPFSNSDTGSRNRDGGPRTEKSQADSRQSPITVISSTTRSGEDLKSPSLDQPKSDECRPIGKDSFMPLTVQTDSPHIGHGHLHNFGFPTGLTGQQFFNHLGSAHPFLLHPSQFNMGGFSNMAAGMGPLLAAVSSGGVSTMDTTSMASSAQSLTGAPGLPFHLQQHVLASQVKTCFLGPRVEHMFGCTAEQTAGFGGPRATFRVSKRLLMFSSACPCLRALANLIVRKDVFSARCLFCFIAR